MSRVLHRLASLKLTVPAMGLLATGVLVSYQDIQAHPGWLVAPLGLLAVNLLAALVTNQGFRRQGGLLVFHLCLLAIVLLVAVGRLTYLKARIELVEGQSFDSAVVEVEQQGPWHAWRLDRITFEQGPVEVDYAPGVRRGHTRSQVLLTDAGGKRRALLSGDDTPLTAASYRFYTTSNKGFAVVLTWSGNDGNLVSGAVHLPSYPLQDWNQVNHWTTPAGTEIELDLQLQRPLPTDRAWTLTSRDLSPLLAVKTAAQSVTLARGDTVRLPGGQLRFEELRLWMGYRITYDPTLPWLFVAAVFGVLGLALHFWGRLFSQPVADMQNTKVGGYDAASGVHG